MKFNQIRYLSSVSALVIVLQICGLIDGCTQKTNKSSRGDGAADFGSNLAISGKLAIDSLEAGGAQVEAAEKTLQIIDDAGTVYSEGKTDVTGVFSLAIDTSMNLTENSGLEKIPHFLYVKSLFLHPGSEKKTAIGTHDTVAIDARDLMDNGNGEKTLDSGTHNVKKVGAIVGKLILETNESPIGIDVYVPGTVYMAKTDENGEFLLGFLPPGTYKLRAEKDSYGSLEWENIAVKLKETTEVGDGVMKISTGPQVTSFSLKKLNTDTGKADLDVAVRKATKYRISKQSDFSDTIFRPIDVNQEKFTISMEISLEAKLVTFYFEAVDNDGLSATSSLTIDREAPTLGSIQVNSSNGLVNKVKVPLLISAQGATKMRFSETSLGLQSGSWVNYAATYSYSLQDLTEGTRTIYAAFSDDAGNLFGINGEISAEFTLDRTPPQADKITLLYPESPTGAFNTPLAWQSTYESESGIIYHVEVYKNANYSGKPVFEKETTETSLEISPPLETAGTYYWRVKPEDAAGNLSSDWVESGIGKRFVVKLFSTGYLSKRDITGEAEVDYKFGKSMIPTGNSRIAISVPDTSYSTDTNSCVNCSAVKIFDLSSNRFVATISEFLPKSSGYGQKLITCDLNGDNADELVVAAPGYAVTYDGVEYRNAGAVFVYNLSNFNLLAYYENELSGSHPVAGYQYCANWNESPCKAYGYPNSWISEMDYPYFWEKRAFGWDMSCVRNDSGQDILAVGEPGYATSELLQPGAVWSLTYNGSGFTRSQSPLVTANSVDWHPDENEIPNANRAAFGTSVVYLSKFSFDCGSGAETGPMLAVGTPQLNLSSEWTDYSKGAFSVFKYADSSWQECDTVMASGGDFSYYAYFGSRMFNLGNIDDDGNHIEELAVSAPSWDYGVVKIYGSTTKSIKKSDANFGYTVAAVGDWGGSESGKTDIAISSPSKQVMGQWSAGKIDIFDLGQLTNNGTTVKEITGIPQTSGYFGTAIIPVLSGDSIHDSFDDDSILMVSSPGRAVSHKFGVGTIHSIASVKLAVTLPTRIDGTSDNAYMGQSLLAVSDIDQDSVSDFLIGEPGARCEGMKSGVLSLYSVAAKQIIKRSCPKVNPSDYDLGSLLMLGPYSGSIYYGVSSQGGGGPQNMGPSTYLKLIDTSFLLQEIPDNFSQGSFSTESVSRASQLIDFEDKTGAESTSHYDNLALGNTEDNLVKIYESYYYSSTEFMCKYKLNDDDTSSALFGNSSAFIGDINGDSVRDLAIGAPGYPLAQGKGAVFLVPGKTQYTDGTCDDEECCDNQDEILVKSTGQTTNFIKRIDADDDSILTALSRPAYSGFGSYVLALPDIDGPNQGADAFIYVANVNLLEKDSTVIPEYFIFSYTSSSGAIAMVWHEEGSAGSMLGGYAKVITDIDGSYDDLAISCPGCQGRLGNTGQVKILSSHKILTDPTNAVLQMLYNPDPQPSHFGMSMEYADITGDGIRDFVVGADQYNTDKLTYAGAVYIYEIKAIQE